jgi:hypothetical protein
MMPPRVKGKDSAGMARQPRFEREQAAEDMVEQRLTPELGHDGRDKVSGLMFSGGDEYMSLFTSATIPFSIRAGATRMSAHRSSAAKKIRL